MGMSLRGDDRGRRVAFYPERRRVHRAVTAARPSAARERSAAERR